MSEPDQADLIAAAVTAVPGVIALHGGMFGEVATYLPGHRVLGIRANSDGVTEVHVTLRYGTPVRDTAALVRDAAAAVAGGVVDVTVEDVVTASDTTPEAPAS
jgi:uncharacterized alkaline shock family protein YloU